MIFPLEEEDVVGDVRGEHWYWLWVFLFSEGGIGDTVRVIDV